MKFLLKRNTIKMSQTLKLTIILIIYKESKYIEIIFSNNLKYYIYNWITKITYLVIFYLVKYTNFDFIILNHSKTIFEKYKGNFRIN